jgi:hypothetical protein
MALTRPRFGQLNTSIVAESDPITVLHQGATQANVDVGFLFNRANGLISNVALYWSESSQSIVTAFTSNSGATDSNIAVSSYANLTVGNLLLVTGSILGVVGNLQIGNLTANTGVYAVSSVVSGDAYVGGNLTYGTVPVLESTRTVTSIGTAPVAIDWFGSSVYRSAKYVVSTTDVTNSQYQTVDITLVQNGTTSTISSYGEVTSGASTRMTFTSNVMSGNVILWGMGVSANNTIKLVRTLIPV